MSSALTAERLSSSRLIAYAMPTMALQMMMVPLLLYLPPAYTSEPVSMSLTVVGLMFLIGRLFELISDPLIGAASDRTRSRFGRRKPWMVAGLPIASIAGVALVSPPAGASASYLALWLILFYLGWTMVFIPHQTWGGELTNDYQERTRIAGFRESGAMLGYLLATLVPLVYWTWYRGVAAPTFPQIVQAIGYLFAIVLPVGVLACLALVRRGEHDSEAHAPSWRELFAILGRNRPFGRLACAYAIDRLAMGMYFAALPFLLTLVLGLQEHILLISLLNTIPAASLAWVWVPIAARLGKHRTYVLANCVTAAGYLLLFFAPAGALPVALLVQAIVGFGNGGTLIMPPAMTADTVDHDELQSGERQMGGHMAFLAIVFKGGIMLGAPLAFALMAHTGFEGAWHPVTTSQATWIRLCGSLIPAVLLLVPIALMWNFPLNAARHAAVRAELLTRHAHNVAT